MTNKIISNSDILSDLFNKKEYNFLQEIDKKIDIIGGYKNYIFQKENDYKELLEDSEVENERKEKVFNYIRKYNKNIDDLEVRIKELNQAIIRLIVDKETDYKYQSQDVKQTVCFVKDKVDEFITLEENFNNEAYEIDTKLFNIIEGKEEIKEEKKELIPEFLEEKIVEIKTENAQIQEIKQEGKVEEYIEEKTVEVPRRVRQGSALNEINALQEIEKRSKQEVEKTVFFQNNQQDSNQEKENNVLLISEKVGKIFLPYKKEDIHGYLASYPNEYKNYNDVIEKEYVLPLDEFMKNQTLSRFREMYDLIRNKELKSMVEAMKVSTKFMFRYELNPAIIAACNSKNELDKYLYCLEKNKLEEFDVFDIKYELNLL